MSDPRTVLFAKLADLAIAAVQAGLERQVVVGEIQKMADEGKTAEQITEALANMAKTSEDSAQTAINNLPDT